MTFEELSLHPALLRALRAEGYETPTPIQQAAIGPARDGRDLLGCAQTGTGKTAAFALPVLHRLANTPAPAPVSVAHTAPARPAYGRGGYNNRGREERGPTRPVRVLVLTPTRELATQIAERFSAYGKELPLRTAVVFGGVGQGSQERVLRSGVDVLVACPGRLLDLMSQGLVPLHKLEILVLDEADRMLDMGFVHDVRRVLAAIPKERQTLFFSATMPDEIKKLASEMLRDPVYVEVTPAATTAEKVDQSVYFVEKLEKRALLLHLMSDPSVTRALVFARTKHGAGRVAEWLSRQGVPADAIHGDKSQNARERALAAFKRGDVTVLVATDIAARGIDVDGVSHVVNLDLPNEPESYVHRIGRTARAGAAGIAWSLCDVDERAYLKQIERTIRQKVPVVTEHPFRSMHPPPTDEPQRRPQGGQGRPQQGRPQQGQGGGYPRGNSQGHGGRGHGGQGGRPQHQGQGQSQGQGHGGGYSRGNAQGNPNAPPAVQQGATGGRTGSGGYSARPADLNRGKPFARPSR